MRKLLVILLMLLSVINSYAQGIEDKVYVNNCFYSADGNFAYLRALNKTTSNWLLIKIDLATNTVADTYKMIDSNGEELGIRYMFFNEKGIFAAANGIYKLNEETKTFDLYYKYKSTNYEFVRVLGINNKGYILGFIREDGNLNYGERKWGKLLSINPLKNQFEEIVNHSVGGSYPKSFEPLSHQLNIQGSKIIYTDFSKFHWQKIKLSLYDFDTKKSIVLDKYFLLKNYRLHAFDNTFVVEFFGSESKKYLFYNTDGSLVKTTEWDYKYTRYDPTTNHLFMLKKEMKNIDVYDLKTNQIIKTIAYDKSKFPKKFWNEEVLMNEGTKLDTWRNGKYIYLNNLSYITNDLSELTGVFFEFDPYTMQTKPLLVLRAGYTYEDYLEIKEAVDETDKEKYQKSEIQSSVKFQNMVNEIALLSERGNMAGFRKKGDSPTNDAKRIGMVVPSEGVVTHVAQFGQTEKGTVVLILDKVGTTDLIKNETGTKLIYKTFYKYEVAVVTPSMLHTQSCFIGQEIYKEVNDRITKKTNSGYTQTMDFSWYRSGKTLTISSNSGKTCSFELID